MSYNALDTDEQTGEETLSDANEPTIEDEIIYTQTIEKLRKSLELLTKDEMELIQGLFFKNISEVAMAEILDVNQSTISRRKMKILNKLKKILENNA